MKRSVIIVAGGSGTRMGSATPKQFMCLAGRPILMQTIDVFRTFDAQMQIVLVLPQTQHQLWNNLCAQYDFEANVDVVSGGETRFHSVKNGLAKVQPEGLVAVHDGVRPLVSAQTIERCFAETEKSGAVVPVVPINESIRHCNLNNGTNTLVNRDEYVIVQTPQVFHTNLLKEAFEQPYQTSFTDDASVVEAFGHSITLVEGNFENIKITRPVDMVLAEAIISSNK